MQLQIQPHLTLTLEFKAAGVVQDSGNFVRGQA